MGVAIVAIPNERDPVWRYSSEKIPHMTLLFLGEANNISDLPHVIDYVSHIATTFMRPFGMTVDERGILGPDKADVLFFEKDESEKSVPYVARQYLLGDSVIKTAFDSTNQFAGWIPHLTMGYPKAPAKPDNTDSGFYWIEFDKLAVWTDDFTGPEFKLKYSKNSYSEEVMMSDRTRAYLEHHGVLGMKWGVRRENPGGAPSGKVTVNQKTPGGKVEVKGGHGFKLHEDAAKAAAAKQVARSSGTHALSTPELRALVDRMNLEMQYSKLATGNTNAGKKFVSDLLLNIAKQQVTKIATEQVGNLANEALKKKK